MDHITIPIPEGMDESQKADVMAFLTKVASEFTPKRLPMEDDPAFRAEVARKIDRAQADLDAGRTRPAKDAMRQIAAKYGLTIPE